MEKRWGLDLDMSAVRLMCRDGDNWVEHTVEKIDSPDIEDRLRAMIAKIDVGASVDLFLPRDQILYTDVDLKEGEDIRAQIERALDGRTPYGLDELEFDWELSADGSLARVAAIARDTLDEAADFAEVRNLPISGYSSLDIRDDAFPRLPSFDGPRIFEEDPEDDTADTPVTFATGRTPSRPPDFAVAAASMAATTKARITPKPVEPAKPAPDAAPLRLEPTPAPKPQSKPLQPTPASDAPVIHVEDDTPVMRVKAPSVPLNPGVPMTGRPTTARVRTDIAASTVSGQAASLTPPSVKLRRANTTISTIAVFAVVFLLTVGIAVLAWNMLPMRPGSTTQVPAQSGENIIAEGADETATIAAPLPEVEPEATDAAPEDTVVAEEEEAAPVLPEAAPGIQSDVADVALPEADPIPEVTLALGVAPDVVAPRKLAPALRDGTGAPTYDPTTPGNPTPPALAAILTTAPYPGPEPDVFETTDDIYVASIEPSNLAFDAIALPNVAGLLADPVPRLDAPEAPEPAAIDPNAVANALADALAGPGGLIPTELARGLTDRAPRPRPGSFEVDIERQQFGGRSRLELAGLRPPPRPVSAQTEATLPEAAPPSELAVAVSRLPRARPQDFAALVTAARVQREAEQVTASASFQTPDTSSAIEAALESDAEPEARPEPPRRLNIPTTASVARTATIENVIRLNKVNLVGVYGAPNDRRALVRLPSGRYVKVKVGDRVDGGTVAQITGSELLYRKGNRTLSLSVPQG